MISFRIIVLGCFLLPTFLYSQQYSISGKVYDENRSSLPGASVIVLPSHLGTTTNNMGEFELSNIHEWDTLLIVQFIGYYTFKTPLTKEVEKNITILLQPALETLQEVVITDHYAEQRKKVVSLNIEIIGEEFLKKNLGGSLMQTLDRLPGISSLEIGSGQSKPIIRGLGFNRVAVIENGLKHEGQQWGADHGLEIDQYAANRIEIIKGPASLRYGSDAIGGIIDISTPYLPNKNTMGGSLNTSYKSNNLSPAASFSFFKRKDKLYISTRLTALKYADFYVPSNHVNIYDWEVPLHHGQVRNTAGNELNWHILLGYYSKSYKHNIQISHISNRSGFFANASGFEPLDVDFSLQDQSRFDIQMPNQNVSHFKLIHTQNFTFKKSNTLQIQLGFQNNLRQEWMTYSAHGNEPIIFPDSLGFPSDLEKQFHKKVYSGKIFFKQNLVTKLHFEYGINLQVQQNLINGRSFLIPEYNLFSYGVFISSSYIPNKNNRLNVGIRYDGNRINSKAYTDWYAPYKRRAWQIDRYFSSFTWAAGYVFSNHHFTLKSNLGKSFRIPLAQEMSANGFNRHMFRYEFGDTSLNAEVSYQIDLGIESTFQKWAIGISPFLNYFPNFIYLSPSFHSEQWNIEESILQPFYFVQNKVLRAGGELHSHYKPIKLMKLGAIAEYIYSQQLTGIHKGRGLPFATPTRFTFHASILPKDKIYFKRPHFGIDYKFTMAQNNIVPPEKATPHSHIFCFSAGTGIKMRKNTLQVNLQVNNLLNTKYYNHSSYYRLIDLPEPGRNYIINLSLPFHSHTEKH